MIYKCTICGHIHNEEATGILLNELDVCPICKQDISKFVEVENSKSTEAKEIKNTDLAYDKDYAKSDKDIRQMVSLMWHPPQGRMVNLLFLQILEIAYWINKSLPI